MSLKLRLGHSQEPIYLMDGSAFIFRGFFANSQMQRSDGFPTGAVYIVGRVLLKLLKEEKPKHFAFMLDGRGPNFRHEIFPAYKANRPPVPEGLLAQMEPVQRMVQALGLHLEVSDGCEADDCLAATARRFRDERPVIIVGVDKDLRQCLHQNVCMWDPAGKEEKLVTLQSFMEETGLAPAQWPDVQALVGDSSDNVPGVRGIGPKTAEKLLQEYPDLEALRDNMPKLPPNLQKKFEGQLESMFLYRRLTILDEAACPNLNLDAMAVPEHIPAEALTFFKEFEMHSLHRELSELMRRQNSADSPVGTGKQLSLFDMAAPAAPKPDLPPLPVVAKSAALQDCKGLRVALTPGLNGQGLVVAVEGGADMLWTGPLEEFVAYAAEASLLIVPDAKLWLHDLARAGINSNVPFFEQGRCFDLALAAYLLAPEDRDYGWPRLAARHAAESGLQDSRPASLALDLQKKLAGEMEKQGLGSLFRSLEMPLAPVLAHMETLGIGVDLAALSAFLNEVQNDLNRLTAEIYQAAGGEFNIRSAQQIGEVLFKRLGLSAGKTTKGGQAATSVDVLEKLSGNHPVVDKLLEFRKLEKLRSTYLEPLPRLADASGRIHTTFNQTATATGRLSSSNPNLQNIPVRGELGHRMRFCFVAAPGNALISADYSQIELRVLAHYTQDINLLAAFRNKEDIHTRTAALLSDTPPEQVTPEQRRNAKTINFGLIYGMGARKLGQELGISLAEARDFMDRYFARFASIKAFYDEVEEAARRDGYVTTLAGRRRPLPAMLSQSPQLRALAERQSVNTLIQGSAADIIKLAMLAVHRDEELRTLSARLLLQVHDELILEVPAQNAALAGARLAVLMQDIRPAGVALSVPLLVDWGQGHSWGDAH